MRNRKSLSIWASLRPGITTSSSLFGSSQSTTSRLASLYSKPFTTEDDGNTPLHQTVLNCRNAAELEETLKTMDEETASLFARSINNHGLLPLELSLHRTDLDHEERLSIVKTLQPHTIKSPLSPLTASIDVSEVLEKHQAQVGSDLHNNLIMACEIAIAVRKIIQASDTHPDMNHRSNSERELILRKIDSLYAMIDTKIMPAPELIKLARVGNCGEFSQVALDLIRKAAAKVQASIWSLDGKHGNHKVVTLGNINGPDGVFLDAWRGRGGIFPASTMATNLTYYKQLNLGNVLYNIVGPYNPHAISMRCLDSYRPEVISKEEKESLHRQLRF